MLINKFKFCFISFLFTLFLSSCFDVKAISYIESNSSIENISDFNQLSTITNNDDVQILRSFKEYDAFIREDNKSYIFNDENYYEKYDSLSFDSNDVIAIKFRCSSSELNRERKYDGLGPILEYVNIKDNNIDICISVPTLGFDESINLVIFLTSCPKLSISDYYCVFNVYQRDTNEKGSSYYKKR